MKIKEMTGFHVQGIDWVIDPTKNFTHASPERLAQACGFIPTFFHDEMVDVIQDSLMNYGYHMGTVMTNGRLDEDGTFQFPGDPPLPPIAAAKINEMDVFIYQHAIVAYRNEDKPFSWVRMD